MITIYSGREMYMKHLKEKEPSCFMSPAQLVVFAKTIITKYRENQEFWHPTFKSNSPVFVSTIAHACEELGLPYTLILNGQKADLETVFKFFNKAYDLQREYLNHLQKNNKTDVEKSCSNCEFCQRIPREYPLVRCVKESKWEDSNGDCVKWKWKLKTKDYGTRT